MLEKSNAWIVIKSTDPKRKRGMPSSFSLVRWRKKSIQLSINICETYVESIFHLKSILNSKFSYGFLMYYIIVLFNFTIVTIKKNKYNFYKLI